MTEDDDPTSIRSLAVSAEDVVDAYAYSRENPGDAVLRVTPPFHGRMRARIHVYRIDDAQLTDAIHVSPDAIIEDDATTAYPEFVDDHGEGDQVDTETIRTRHAEAIESWRVRARNAIVDEVELETDDGRHRVEIKRLE
ncbi:hypothetical protein [Natrarchaeobius chitinivorans]|uniref:DUF8009 domain-containing protein n=1 Tax=Natrarchaeobius chitinivorans TaxID=1679083 RepID=A0A3N6MI39_NATCH|nr:hypothetical protein [Natrarchaeobius chitinivorans]RQG96620.1 hypothetical protein EA473_05795 [Natrarchaeobius chitinivorans]